MNVRDTMKQILEAESRAIANIPVTDDYERAVKLIVTQGKERGGQLGTSGRGKCGQIAQNIATTFSSTGIPAVFLHPSEAQHGDLGILQTNDVMLLLSNSGKTREIVELVSLVHSFSAEMKFIVVTGNPESELAHHADICLWTGGAPEVCPLGLTPTTSTTIMTVIGDILVVNVMKETGFTKQDYALRHHGGYLGIKSRQGEDPAFINNRHK
ncbi:MAG: SIS domain-containing protein [Muribaculaceae bacterium]|nr:SIS domain-containing protein [Muribaculaceae bacterium]